jgi:cyclopropane-fatty-acyl-phospholipid synthase
MSPRFARAIVNLVLRRLNGGTLIIEDPTGAQRSYGTGSPVAVMRMGSECVWMAFFGGSVGLAEAYADGLWESPDPVELVRIAARNMPALDRVRRIAAPALRPVEVCRSLYRPRGRRQRRRDIAAHYDLGNAMFSRMLDPTMTYSCAFFAERGMSLEEAQIAKLERVCEKLDLGPDDRVLEIGTGWGSFALHAAATRGCHVTTTTISREQYDYVCDRVSEEGLADRITVLAEDFRDLGGRYDKLVSIEMIEAVGWQNLGAFLAGCSDLLKPGGVMLLQAIAIDDRAYEVEKATRSFIKEYIFPGGSLPSLAAMTRSLARRTDLQTLDVEDITEHYIETLQHWRRRFVASSVELEANGYDDRFKRIWTLYLAYCEGGFVERRITDLQLLLGKPGVQFSAVRDRSSQRAVA